MHYFKLQTKCASELHKNNHDNLSLISFRPWTVFHTIFMKKDLWVIVKSGMHDSISPMLEDQMVQLQFKPPTRDMMNDGKKNKFKPTSLLRHSTFRFEHSIPAIFSFNPVGFREIYYLFMK